ncbi:MAG TPA: hypothetical protein VFW87_16955 [Pirellulales bacterium]|nr:hypothetical protein [Pirellulales bacterium]
MLIYANQIAGFVLSISEDERGLAFPAPAFAAANSGVVGVRPVASRGATFSGVFFP